MGLRWALLAAAAAFGFVRGDGPTLRVVDGTDREVGIAKLLVGVKGVRGAVDAIVARVLDTAVDTDLISDSVQWRLGRLYDDLMKDIPRDASVHAGYLSYLHQIMTKHKTPDGSVLADRLIVDDYVAERVKLVEGGSSDVVLLLETLLDERMISQKDLSVIVKKFTGKNIPLGRLLARLNTGQVEGVEKFVKGAPNVIDREGAQKDTSPTTQVESKSTSVEAKPKFATAVPEPVFSVIDGGVIPTLLSSVDSVRALSYTSKKTVEDRREPETDSLKPSTVNSSKHTSPTTTASSKQKQTTTPSVKHERSSASSRQAQATPSSLKQKSSLDVGERVSAVRKEAEAEEKERGDTVVDVPKGQFIKDVSEPEDISKLLEPPEQSEGLVTGVVLPVVSVLLVAAATIYAAIHVPGDISQTMVFATASFVFYLLGSWLGGWIAGCCYALCVACSYTAPYAYLHNNKGVEALLFDADNSVSIGEYLAAARARCYVVALSVGLLAYNRTGHFGAVAPAAFVGYMLLSDILRILLRSLWAPIPAYIPLIAQPLGALLAMAALAQFDTGAGSAPALYLIGYTLVMGPIRQEYVMPRSGLMMFLASLVYFCAHLLQVVYTNNHPHWLMSLLSAYDIVVLTIVSLSNHKADRWGLLFLMPLNVLSFGVLGMSLNQPGYSVQFYGALLSVNLYMFKYLSGTESLLVRIWVGILLVGLAVAATHAGSRPALPVIGGWVTLQMVLCACGAFQFFIGKMFTNEFRLLETIRVLVVVVLVDAVGQYWLAYCAVLGITVWQCLIGVALVVDEKELPETTSVPVISATGLSLLWLGLYLDSIILCLAAGVAVVLVSVSMLTPYVAYCTPRYLPGLQCAVLLWMSLAYKSLGLLVVAGIHTAVAMWPYAKRHLGDLLGLLVTAVGLVLSIAMVYDAQNKLAIMVCPTRALVCTTATKYAWGHGRLLDTLRAVSDADWGVRAVTLNLLFWPCFVMNAAARGAVLQQFVQYVQEVFILLGGWQWVMWVWDLISNLNFLDEASDGHKYKGSSQCEVTSFRISQPSATTLVITVRGTKPPPLVFSQARARIITHEPFYEALNDLSEDDLKWVPTYLCPDNMDHAAFKRNRAVFDCKLVFKFPASFPATAKYILRQTQTGSVLLRVQYREEPSLLMGYSTLFELRVPIRDLLLGLTQKGTFAMLRTPGGNYVPATDTRAQTQNANRRQQPPPPTNNNQKDANKNKKNTPTQQHNQPTPSKASQAAGTTAPPQTQQKTNSAPNSSNANVRQQSQNETGRAQIFASTRQAQPQSDSDDDEPPPLQDDDGNAADDFWDVD